MNEEYGLLSQDYIECVRRLRKLHDLIRGGECDSDQAEAIRDEMDDYWLRMTSEEREWSGDLSADLHVIGEDQPLFGDRPTDGTFRRQLLDAARRDDWVGLRKLLSADANLVDHFDRLLFRSVYWAALEDHESSLEFLECLARLVEVERSKIEMMQSNNTRVGNVDEEPTVQTLERFTHLGRLALGRMSHVSEEIDRLILDVRSMSSSESANGAEPAPWDVVKARFFQAEEQFQSFLDAAA